MVNVNNICAYVGCTKHASFDLVGTKKVQYGAQHAEDGMANVVSKKCVHVDRTKLPPFGMAGTRTKKFRA